MKQKIIISKIKAGQSRTISGLLFWLLLNIMCPGDALAQEKKPILLRSTLSVSGTSQQVHYRGYTYLIQQSFGQDGGIGSYNLANHTIWQGFIHPNVLSKIIGRNAVMDLQVDVYPVPFFETLNLAFRERMESHIQISIYDLNGLLIYTNQFSPSSQIKINLSEISSAHYILQVQHMNRQSIRRIFKKPY